MADFALEYDSLETLRRVHPAWRLLAADHAPFIIGFLQRAFIEPNMRSLPEQEILTRLEDHLFHLRERKGGEAFKRAAKEYLDEWSSSGRAWLRKYYPPEGDEPHFDLTSATEKAIEWVSGLGRRQFVGTESRLMTVFELLRQLAEGTEADPEARIAELEKRRSRIEADIRSIREGRMSLMDPTRIRDRFLQMASTARGLLGDFREVEQNFRDLDRSVRDRIATWDGSKASLLQDVFGASDAIRDSDQGRSFQAFWDFLMSPARQEELTSLLETVLSLPPVEELRPDLRLLKIHFDWLQAGEQAQRTVARLSSQLRRYLDDQTALENRRIMQILKSIEQHAVAVRDLPPSGNWMEIEDPAPMVDLSMDRPLYSPPLKPMILDGDLEPGDGGFEADALYNRKYVDKEALKGRIRKLLQAKSQITLEELVESFPLEQGLSEIIAYLSLASEDRGAVIDDSARQSLVWTDASGTIREAVLPFVTFHR
ncbi:MAG TPA: DUF3375 domain-containing protein [Fibrobacteria bacterium]|nr:DUF3375 domain-containing protein [Fibrobacteria bacterium]